MLNINHFQSNGAKMLKNQQKLMNKKPYKARGCIFLMLCILLIAGIMPLIKADITSEYYDVGDDESGSLYGNRYSVQTFTIGNVGLNKDIYIINVSLKVNVSVDPGNITLNIKNVNATGYPIGGNLSTGWLAGSSITTGSSEWYNFTMPSTLLNSSTQYAIEIRASEGNATKYLRWARDGTSATYTGGQFIYTTNGGSSWIPLPTKDSMFRLYGLVENLTVTLISPSNDTAISDIGTNFTANYTSYTSDLTNATYYIYKDGAIFNQSTVEITGTDNSTTLYIDNFTLGSYLWNVLACNNNGECEWGDNNFSLGVGGSIINETYNNETYETSEEYFEITVGLLSGVILYDSNFIYNGTIYNADYDSLGGNLYKISTTFNVPSVDSSTVFDFFWQLSYLSGVIVTQNLTARQQTVIPIADLVITNNTCGAGFSEAIHYDFFDEKNLTDLDYVNVKYNFQYGYGNLTSNLLYGNIEGISDLRVCINSTFNNYLIGYGEVEYSDENHSLRRHYLFERRTLSNTTTSNISLYSLYKSISTSFLVEIRTPTLSPYVNKYISLLRWYPSLNKYNVVEMGRTDDKGQTVSKVESEDADYRIGVYELNGTLIYLASPIRMVCVQSPCTYILSVPDEEDISYTNFLGLEFTDITYSNGVFYFQYNDPSQSTESISLSVYKVTGSYKSLICTDSSTSFTDLLICNVSSYSGNLFAVVYRTASPLRTIINKWINAGTTLFTNSIGLFITLLILITLILLGSVSPIIAIVFGIFALIPALVLKTITYPILISIAIIGGIVIHFMRKA